MSRHRSSVGLRWPSNRIAALHRLPIRSVLAARCALRCAPMAARSLRHLIGDATPGFREAADAAAHICAARKPPAARPPMLVRPAGPDAPAKSGPGRAGCRGPGAGPRTVRCRAARHAAVPGAAQAGPAPWQAGVRSHRPDNARRAGLGCAPGSASRWPNVLVPLKPTCMKRPAGASMKGCGIAPAGRGGAWCRSGRYATWIAPVPLVPMFRLGSDTSGSFRAMDGNRRQ
ncbi:hypothetical protein D5047_15965 [Verminephrobacter eiseniae]|nr:hypothetical protein [Verminephrobacter eiseniae]